MFWRPTAFAIMCGLFVAMILTLVAPPVLYLIFFDAKGPAKEKALA